jgi:hypothetical protein
MTTDKYHLLTGKRCSEHPYYQSVITAIEAKISQSFLPGGTNACRN